MSLSPGTVLQGRYRILEPLGAGGMGTVYRAEGTILPRLWAVKEMSGPEPGDPEHHECLQRFRREAEILARLHHPRLPRVVDFFEEEGRHYLVMDLVEGEDLAKLLDSGRRVSWEEALAWGDQVLEVLEYLHGQDPPVVVGDLKPSNLILTPAGELVLVDFGIARTLRTGTRTALLAPAGYGSPGYAPPEQYTGAPPDPRSDLYALGATLYHLLTGKPPAESVHLATGVASPVPPSRLHDCLPQAVDELLARAMAFRPDDRFPDARSMRAALKEVLQSAGRGDGPCPADADRRARQADAAGRARRRPAWCLPGDFLRDLRERFHELGWQERKVRDLDLVLEAPGFLPPMLLVRGVERLDEQGMKRELSRLLERVDRVAGGSPRTIYYLLVAGVIPNPLTVGHLAGGIGSTGGWRRVLVIPADLSRGRVLEEHIPARLRRDNDLKDPLLNLKAVVGRHRR